MSRPVVGIDLAWGERSTSGVVVIEGNDVVVSATVTRDDELDAFVPPGPVVVAFDAPIVVPNLTGRRPCDAEVSSRFARFHAGAYPANRSIPWLAEPRAGRLAERWGLDVALDADRVAVEVYPHAASVVLFGLDRVLPYKRRAGRTLGSRREAFARLLGHLAELATHDPPLRVAGSPRWSALTVAIADATTQAALDRVEDELDAHLCGYVGHLLDVAPGRCDVLGQPAEGAILVPSAVQ